MKKLDLATLFICSGLYLSGALMGMATERYGLNWTPQLISIGAACVCVYMGARERK